MQRTPSISWMPWSLRNKNEWCLLCNKNASKKWKHVKDSARKISLKYKKQTLETHYSSAVVNSPDSSYGSLQAEAGIDQAKLLRLCSECLERLHKSAREIEEISELSADQADDGLGKWIMLHPECVTPSSFGSIVKRRCSFASLVSRLYMESIA